MTAPIARPEDDLVFLDENHDTRVTVRPPTTRPVWRVMIIDDDSDVHAATTFALGNLDMQGRPLEFLHAHSASEARALLIEQSDIAVILLDVVMENEDAGLQLVRFIREDCRLSEVRIILRTGQPGYAPEMDAIRDYDINDYKTKSELTRIKLFTAVTAGIRSYQQICAINSSRRGLDFIVRASAQLLALPDLSRFAAGVADHIAQLLGSTAPSLLIAREHGGNSFSPTGMMVVAARGIWRGWVGQAVPASAPTSVTAALTQSVLGNGNSYHADYCTLFFGTASCDYVLYQQLTAAISPTEQQLLDVFTSNLAGGFENMRLMSRLNDVAFYDPLCGLPNRTRLVELLNQVLETKSRSDTTLALVDIDHFAETNDAFGHGFGDQLLLAVAARLQSSLDRTLVVARVGGDTFSLLGAGARVTPALIHELFTAPFNVDDEAVPLSATIGLLRLEDYAGSGAEALKDADIALKRAKTTQRSGHFYFSRNMGVDIRDRVRMMHALRADFVQRKLTVVYQPQVVLATRRPVGAEALLRWCDSEGNCIAPEVFIPIAENSGLIIELGEWVLRTACEELVRLQTLGSTDFMMSVNVSQVQFRHPRFLNMLRAALADTGAPAHCIELEITESMAMEDPSFLIRTLDMVKRTGVSIAIDDFGTGFSSLSYLQQLKIDRLKIDRAFVTEITAAKRGDSIAEMIVQLGRNLDLVIIAEGVEDELQAAKLGALGCPLAQGYLFAEAMPAAALADWLQRHRLP
ncbi:MAG: EAL domain-containing protein [Pseudomonadota bacterium]|nr:EAL domain-containing protein [Pseudomonadota bacterium]